MATITQLEYLISVDKERHFGRAAKASHVSQPSLSVQIQNLEDELEVMIFDRSKKPIQVTEIGREIIDQAKIIQSEHKKLTYLAKSSSNVPKGDFSLAVIPTLAPYVIPLFVGAFSREFPEVRLKIHEHKTEDIVRLINSEDIDAGLLVTPLEEEGIEEHHLFYEPFYCYLAENHPLGKKKYISESDLGNHDLWLLTEGHCFRNQVLNVCSSQKNAGVLPNVGFESGNLETLKNLVRRNSGYTLLPELSLADLTEQDMKTHVRRFKKPIPTREVGLVYKKNFYKTSIVKALEASIIESIPSDLSKLREKDLEVVSIN